MKTNEPEIVTVLEIVRQRHYLENLKASYGDEVKLFVDGQGKVLGTIELFAGLLEEICCLGCEEDWELCEPCQRKAAALRRYRGE